MKRAGLKFSNSKPAPLPRPASGEVRIKVKAFGLNRSELFTRQGHSPTVKFPKILGLQATGIVEAAPGGEFTKGDVVATAMGGMGRQFDGGSRHCQKTWRSGSGNYTKSGARKAPARQWL